MELDAATCRVASAKRDPRFDGRFFVGVHSTGIFCRPICPAKTPKPENVRYYGSAAAAHEAGLRPCRRCRPETAPGTPAWNGTSATVNRALRLIGDGALDEAPLERLADRLGVGERQLRRLFQQHLGASPIAVAQVRRLHFAKRLVDETDWPISRIAFAAGYRSIRRWNSAFREAFGCSPVELREKRSAKGSGPLVLRLAGRPPYAAAPLLEFLEARAIPGVEEVKDGAFRRVFRIDGATGFVEVRPDPATAAVEARIELESPAALPRVVARLRRLFDLDCDPAAVVETLGRDPLLRSSLRRDPGLRVPGAFEPFEAAVRAVVGQQVTVAAATTLMGRLAERFGEPSGRDDLPRIFPSAERLAEADVASIGLPGARAAALRGLAAEVASGRLRLDLPTPDLEERLLALRGIGPWTASYILLRALGDPDAFPHGDLVLRKAAPGIDLLAHAERWRPFRAYATHHLWRLA